MRKQFLLMACLSCAGMALAESSLPSDESVASAPPVAQCASHVKYHRNGKLESCRLSQAYSVGSIELPPGSAIFFNSDGHVGGAWLGKESSVYGQLLPEGTALFVTADGQLRHFWLPRDTFIQGHLAKGQDDGAGSRLHRNGKLLAIWLAGDEEIDGIPCTSSGNVFRMGLGVISLGTQRMAWFYDNGRLQQAMLARGISLQGHDFKKGDVVSLTPDGKVDFSAKKLSEW